VLLCEASYTDAPDLPPNLHLTGREAGEHAAKAAVDRLLLTHVPPWTDAARVYEEAVGAFDGPVELVAAGTAHEP
jgi:ribonuclease BN (tRNA processing enzyme)